MLVARISPYFRYAVPHPQEIQLPLQLAYLAGAFLAEGWEVSVSDGWLEPQVARDGSCRLPPGRFDLAVVVVETLNAGGALALAQALKSRGTPLVVAVGQMALAMPELLLAPRGPFDACVNGEAESVLPDLARVSLRGGDPARVRGLTLPPLDGPEVRYTAPRAYESDPDRFPRPAYSCFDLDAYSKMSSHVPVIGPVRWGWLLTSRGCDCGCTFCSPVLRKSVGSRYRVHSIEYVLGLVDELQGRYRCNALAFEDDHFTRSRERTMALCQALAARRRLIPWTAQARVDTLDGELIDAMRRAGCAGLCMGIESADQATRREYKKCGLSNQEFEELVRQVHAAGIHTTLYFMLGFPGETLEGMQATLDFARRLRPLMIQVAFYTPYPGSRAWDRLAGQVAPEEALNQSHYNSLVLGQGAVEPAAVRAFQQRFYRDFYLDPAYLWRYASQRLPFTITQGHEVKLALRTLYWLAARAAGG